MKKDLSQLTTVLERLGFDQYSGNHNARPLVYLFTVMFLIVNATLFVIFHWDDLDKRVDGIKVLVLYFRCLGYLLAYLVNWDKSIMLIKTLDEGAYKFPYKSTMERLNLERSIRNGLLQLNTIWYYGCISFGSMEILPTIAVLMLQIIRYFGEGLTIEALFLPEPFYFPSNYDTLHVYFFAFMLQVILYMDGVMFAYCIVVSGFVSMKMVESELKLLRLSIEEMDRYINGEVSCHALREFGLHIVIHHNDIYRKAKNVVQGIPLVAITSNSLTSLQLCISIYMIVQSDNLVANIVEGWYCFLLTSSLYFCNLMGERILIEDENLRKALYKCSWLDKPNWFKKSLQIIMARTNRPIEITSAGLFTLNLKIFSTTIQSAYSFYNLLNNYKH